MTNASGYDRNIITAALPKGRLAEKTIELLIKCGVDMSGVNQESRKLVQGSGEFRFIFVKPSDVATYVERGVADIGTVGKDTLMEAEKDVYEMLDLKFGGCRLCVAGYPESRAALTDHNLRVATKFENIARKFYGEKNINIDLIRLNGSVELAPVIGMSDVIVDIVESGKTLEANGLTVLEEICAVSARLIVNKVSLKTKAALLRPLITKMENAVLG